MRHVFLSILLLVAVVGLVLVGSPDQVWANPPGSIMSYREWKSSRIQEAELRLSSAKAKLGIKERTPNLAKTTGLEAGRSVENLKIENQIKGEEMALEMALDLTVSDYFAGYLTKLANKDSAFKDVAGRLSADDVAELMSAYANSVFGTQTGALPPSAQNLGSESIK